MRLNQSKWSSQVLHPYSKMLSLNTVVYHEDSLVMIVKGFMVQAPGANIIKSHSFVSWTVFEKWIKVLKIIKRSSKHSRARKFVFKKIYRSRPGIRQEYQSLVWDKSEAMITLFFVPTCLFLFKIILLENPNSRQSANQGVAFLP